MKRAARLVVAFVVMLALYPALVGAPAKATTGDLVGTVKFSQDCGSGLGVGIAFDGTNLWISCHASVPDLLRANPTTGAVDATYNITGGLGALASLSSSSLSAIRVVSFAYLRLLRFLPAILIPACVSSSPAFLMMYSAYKLNKQGDNTQP
ncbi:MAG TPA: hypothetical protein VIV12_15545 [Streptosporangiaceae bacterium]